MDFNSTNFEVTYKDPEIIDKMATIAAKIALYNFKWRYVTLVIYTAQALGIETFSKIYNNSLYLRLDEFEPRHRAPVTQFVVFAHDTADMKRLVNWLVNIGFDNTGNFILVCTSADHRDCSELQILHASWKNRVVNVVLLEPSDGSDEPSAFTYFPILEGKCLNSDPVKLSLSPECPSDGCYRGVFPEKLVTMHGCSIVISTFEEHPFMYLHGGKQPPSGRDGDLLNLIMDIMNATLNITTAPDGDWGHYENKNWTGAIGAVYNGRAHASMCSAPLTYTKYGNFQISFAYDSVDMVWVAALPALRPPWEKLLYPFKIYIRIIIFVMFIMIVFINTFMKTPCWKKIRKVVMIAPPKMNLLFYSWTVFLGMPISKVPSKPALLSIVISWVWFTFILRAVYQGGLIDSLKHRKFESNFISFAEVLRNKRPFGGLASLREFYAEDPHIYKNWVELTSKDMYPLLDKMTAGDSEFVLAANRETVIEYLIYYKGVRQLQIIPEKIVNSPTVMYFKKYSPLRTPISRILWISFEAGFVERLSHRFLAQKHLLFSSRDVNEDDQKPLHLVHFAGSIAILLGGWLLSIFFFCIEYVCEKIDAYPEDVLVAGNEVNTIRKKY